MNKKFFASLVTFFALIVFFRFLSFVLALYVLSLLFLLSSFAPIQDALVPFVLSFLSIDVHVLLSLVILFPFFHALFFLSPFVLFPFFLFSPMHQWITQSSINTSERMR